ncbi:hypothetical protein AB0J21_05250 [Streptomyces sp. NPDC049954]|uniref:hypothetical protein n=1 Tax=Streptomyces sp. NPDC049954 TaxID=3155779 RepID=UPI003431870F
MNRRRRPLLTVTALCAVAAFSLTACGGGDDASDDKADKPVAGVDTSGGSSPSVSPSPSPSASAAPGRPKIELPADVTYKFEWPETGDAKKDAVMADTRQFLQATDMAISRQDPDDPAFRFYSEGDTAAGAQAYVQRFVDTHDRVTGLTRYSKPDVKINEDGTAGFAYCEDQSKSYRKSVKTGKTKLTQGSKDDYVLYNSRLRLNTKGVWVSEKLISVVGSATCQP